MVKTVYVTGYKSFELNIFKDDAPEVSYLKKFIAHKLEQLLDEGLEWVLIQGQMGIELWTAEVVIELKESYPELKLGILLFSAIRIDGMNRIRQSTHPLCDKLILRKAFIIQNTKVHISSNKLINLC